MYKLSTIFTLMCFIYYYYLLLQCLAVNGETPNHHPFQPTEEVIATNCGSYANSINSDGRQWIGDTMHTNKFFVADGRQNGKTKSLKATAAEKKKKDLHVDRVPYSTARVSHSPFTYTFNVISGPTFIRLHFYPTSYAAAAGGSFASSNAIFTVKAGPYTLLSNFSTSLESADDAFGLKPIVKEFSLHVEENNPLSLTFSPSRTHHHHLDDDEVYAFVNGIEVVSMPAGVNPTTATTKTATKPGQRFASALLLHGRTAMFTIVVLLLSTLVHNLPKKVQNRVFFSYPPEELCRRFSLAEMKSATKNFDDGLVIGRGGFGNVYKGNIEGMTTKTVAIKRLSGDSNQGAGEFWTEVGILSKFQHDHILALIGYCHEGKEMILVYEYMKRGTLADHLHKSNNNNNDGQGRLGPLTWESRLRICLDAARGLNHLHINGSEFNIIHRDVKSTNVLLNENWVAKISDFGMCKKMRLSHSLTQIISSTLVKGTFGYIDPQYFSNGTLTMKTDVYSFGVVLWEVLCGRPAVDMRAEEEQRSLALWAQSCFKDGNIDQMIDPSLRGQIPVASLKLFSTIAMDCLQNHFTKRPSMADVVCRLQSIYDSLSDDQEIIDSSVQEFEQHGNEEIIDPPIVPEEELSGKDLERGSTSISVASPLKSGYMKRRSQAYSLHDLNRATQNFSQFNKLGEGTFGSVFKGWINEKTLEPCGLGEGIPVAIKKHDRHSFQGLEEWQAEVSLLGSLSHPNLIKLFGYCWEDRAMLLVYEYAEKGDLEHVLFSKNTATVPLSWNMRLKIAIGSARALAFLHTSSVSIIIRDLKPSNILLDKDYNAKLSDFGLAKLGPSGDSTHVTTRVMGTYGYAAPDYVATGHLNHKSDVYSFGVVLLEILTGLRALDKYRPQGKQRLVEWARPYLGKKTKIKYVMDSRIEGQYSSEGAMKTSSIALQCLEALPKSRPSMKEVAEALEQIAVKERVGNCDHVST